MHTNYYYKNQAENVFVTYFSTHNALQNNCNDDNHYKGDNSGNSEPQWPSSQLHTIVKVSSAVTSMTLKKWIKYLQLLLNMYKTLVWK